MRIISIEESPFHLLPYRNVSGDRRIVRATEAQKKLLSEVQAALSGKRAISSAPRRRSKQVAPTPNEESPASFRQTIIGENNTQVAGEWRQQLYKSIWSKAGRLGLEKQEVYDLAFQRLVLKKPVSSLKELGEQKLKKLYDIIIQM